MYIQTSANGCHERKRRAVKNTAYRIFDPVPFTRVTIEDTFWVPRLRVNREKTIPHILTVSLLSVGTERNKYNSQKLFNSPNVIGKTSSHSWRSLLPTSLF